MEDGMDARSHRLGRPRAHGDGSARLEALVPVPIGAAVAAAGALLYAGRGPAPRLGHVAVSYIGWLACVLLGRDAEQSARRARITDPDRVATDVALLTAAVASLITVAFVLVRASGLSGTLELVQLGFGVVSVVVSWAMVHALFTQRYAALYY